jgi:hypothetical protein
MIDLTIYGFLWLLGIVFFLLSLFVRANWMRLVFNIIAFIIFISLGMMVDVSTTTIMVINNTTTTVSTSVEGINYLQYFAWMFGAITFLRAVMHMFQAATGDE